MDSGASVLELLRGLILLLLIAAGVRAFSNRTRLPFSVLLVFVGILLALIAKNFPQAFPPLHQFKLSSEIILFLFLPTLVYESSQAMDVRELRKNIVPIITLAVPGLLLSTAIIGITVALLTSLSLPVALLLGAILSATDPVAVISIFKRLGAPKRLFVLIEGESLFNDATSLVLSRILVTIILGGVITLESVGQGVLDFFVVFLGGIGVGIVLGMIAGYLLGKVKTESFIVITITTVLAYLSFIVAEELFHVSGVMAVVAAGLTFSAWGWMKVTPPVRTYLDHFWEYAAFLANALIFLFVGLTVELGSIFRFLPILVFVILGMLVSRAVIIYGLTPFVDVSSKQRFFQRGYKPVLFWGGLRGAVALAIVLSLPQFGQNEMLESVVIGAVLFTLFVQGLSIEPLVKLLGLHKPALTDQFIVHQHLIDARRLALQNIEQYAASEVFSQQIMKMLKEKYDQAIEEENERLEQIRSKAEEQQEQRRILYLQTLSQELSVYLELFNKGHLGERAFRELQLDLANQLDAVRYMADVRQTEYGRFHPRVIEQFLLTIFDHIPPLAFLAERRRRARLAINYEISWGHREGSAEVLKKIETLEKQKTLPVEMLSEIQTQYEHWHEAACRQLDLTADQFPEFVQSMQQKLAERLALLKEREYIEDQMEHGSLPVTFGEHINAELEKRLEKVREHEVAELNIEPSELLRKVSFFKAMNREEFDYIAEKLIPRTANEHEIIIRQGDPGKSLFLISRGVVRVTREENGVRKDLSSLFAGDFFGEMALLHGENRSATVRAVTPCYLYELQREALEETMHEYPYIRSTLQEFDRQRKADQHREDTGHDRR